MFLFGWVTLETRSLVEGPANVSMLRKIVDLENAAMTRNEMTMTWYQENVTRELGNARGGYFKDFSPLE